MVVTFGGTPSARSLTYRSAATNFVLTEKYGNVVKIYNLFASHGGTLSVGLVALLVLGVFGGVPLSSVPSFADVGVPMATAGDATPATQEGENNTTNVTISIVRAMETAQNRTNGTAVGAELGREGNVTDLERPSRIYEVDVLAANGTHYLVDVNATDGSVRHVRTPDNETGFLEGLFGNDDEVVSDRKVNLSEIRSAGDAVRLVRNETEDNRTVTTVELTSRNGTLLYDVQVVTDEGARQSVPVAAKPTEGGILSNGTTEGEGGQPLW